MELLLSAATCWMLKGISVQLEFKYFHCFSKAVNPTPNNIFGGSDLFFPVEMY
uniref:Alternative protein CCBL2 n=1 Tax=Homo sapiens TaxID=9606 RepID=L0R594_HUMAN|nr:alternative protein CCBL2 [Homo sapiens]